MDSGDDGGVEVEERTQLMQPHLPGIHNHAAPIVDNNISSIFVAKTCGFSPELRFNCTEILL